MGNAHHGRVRRVMSRGSVRRGFSCATLQTAKLVIGPAIGSTVINIHKRPESSRYAAGMCTRVRRSSSRRSSDASYALGGGVEPAGAQHTGGFSTRAVVVSGSI